MIEDSNKPSMIMIMIRHSYVSFRVHPMIRTVHLEKSFVKCAVASPESEGWGGKIKMYAKHDTENDDLTRCNGSILR